MCALQISVLGQAEEHDAIARLKVFESTNRLESERPVLGTLGGEGSFKYYWFVSYGARDAEDELTFWQNTISLGVKTKGADFDLFVSVMDARYPVENDYDFKSTNFGADTVYLSSEDPVFGNSNSDSWDPSYGMVVVVGVQALQDYEAEFSLIYNGPSAPDFAPKELQVD